MTNKNLQKPPFFPHPQPNHLLSPFAAVFENADQLYFQQNSTEKRELLNFLLSNCTFESGNLCPEWRKPFDILINPAIRSVRGALLNEFRNFLSTPEAILIINQAKEILNSNHIALENRIVKKTPRSSKRSGRG